MHMSPLSIGTKKPSEKQIRRLQLRAGEHLDALAALVKADAGARYDENQAGLLFSPMEIEEKVDPALTGKHLIDRGMSPGPNFKPILERALKHQLETGEMDPEVLFNLSDNVRSSQIEEEEYEDEYEDEYEEGDWIEPGDDAYDRPDDEKVEPLTWEGTQGISVEEFVSMEEKDPVTRSLWAGAYASAHSWGLEVQGSKVIGSWFDKMSRNIRPKDFDVMLLVKDLSPVIGTWFPAGAATGGFDTDIFLTDGTTTLVPLQTSPQAIVYRSLEEAAERSNP